MTLVSNCANHPYIPDRHSRTEVGATGPPYYRPGRRNGGAAQDCGGDHSRGLSGVTLSLLAHSAEAIEGLVLAALDEAVVGVILQLSDEKLIRAELAAVLDLYQAHDGV